MAATVQTLAGLGWANVLGIAKEVTYGTAVTPTVYLPGTGEFTGSNKPIRRMGARKTSGSTIPSVGQYELKGTIDLEVEPDSIGYMLGWALGVDTQTTLGSSSYQHLLTLGSPRNSFTVSADYGKNSIYQMDGCKIDTVDFTCKPNSYLEAKFGIVGQNLTILPTQSLSPTYGSIVPFSFEQIYVASSATVGAQAQPIDTFSISLKNNLKPTYSAGSARYIRNINETQTQVTGSFNLPYESDFVQNLILSPTFTTLNLNFTHTTLTGPGQPYNIQFYMPNVLLEAGPITAKRDAVTSMSVKFSAYESGNGNQDDLQVTLINRAATNYSS